MQLRETNQVIDNMWSRSVPPWITEPLTTRRHIAPHNTSGIGNTAITASVFSEISFTILIVIIIPSVLKIQPTHPRGKRIHHLAVVPTAVPRPAALGGATRSRGDRWGIGLVIGAGSPNGAALRRVRKRIGRSWPCYRRPNRVTEFRVVEILALCVKFKKGVGVVAGVGLRSGVE